MPSPLFVAAGHGGLRFASADGKTWSAPARGKEGEAYRAAAGGNGRIVAVGSFGGNNIVASTADGKTWKTQTKDAGYVRYLRGLAFGNGTFVGFGGDPGSVGAAKPFTMLTTDGETWVGPHEIDAKFMLRRAAFGAGKWVAVGDRGLRAVSTDAKVWKLAPETKAIDTLVDVAFGNGTFVGVGLHGMRMRTADGLKWTDKQMGDEGVHINSIVWAKDKFVGVGAGATFVSADGAKWEKHANADAPTAVAFGNGVFVGIKWRGKILRSTDGIKWETAHTADLHLETVAFAEIG